jgi:hypothetical protein
VAVRQPRYSKEEFAQRGHALYDSSIRSVVEEGNLGKIVAIDIDTGAFEVADESLVAAKKLLARFPDAQIFGIRIGHLAVHRFGLHVPGIEE